MLQVQTGLTTVFLAGTTVIVGLVAFILLYIIIYLNKTNRLTSELQQKELDKQTGIFKALIEGEEKERKRLAEELHDGIGAKLAGIKMNIEFLRSSDMSSLLLDKTLSGLNETINELREISHNLQPSIVSIKGLKEALLDYINNLNTKNIARLEFYWDAETEKITGAEIETTIYRISTELLHNAYKHACAKNILLQISTDNDILILMIEDNGLGMQAENQGNGIGLLNINNRLNQLNGKMNIDSTPGKGTTIIIEIPIESA